MSYRRGEEEGGGGGGGGEEGRHHVLVKDLITCSRRRGEASAHILIS